MNQALLLGSVRQHELTEAAELLNVQLQAAIILGKKTEQALIDSEKLASAGRMAAVLAHEINNPLAAVMNLLFLAQSGSNIPKPVRQYLRMADGELKRIAHITLALPQIFEPFITTKGSIGNGLGLWVCKQIIEKHGGSACVRSRTCEPHGTTFSMVLPE